MHVFSLFAFVLSHHMLQLYEVHVFSLSLHVSLSLSLSLSLTACYISKKQCCLSLSLFACVSLSPHATLINDHVAFGNAQNYPMRIKLMHICICV